MIPAALLLSVAAAGAPPAPLLVGERQRIEIALRGGLPVAWIYCAAACPDDADRTATPSRVELLSPAPGGGRLRWVVPGDPAATTALNDLEYRVDRGETAARTHATLTARAPLDGRMLIQRYELDRGGRLLSISLQAPPRARLELTGGRSLAPEEMPGLGGIYSDARAVVVGRTGQKTLTDEGRDAVAGRALAAGDWAGVRGRFWTIMIRSTDPVVLDASEETPDTPVLQLGGADASTGDLRLELYGGPVARADLASAAPELPGMLYAVLWEPLRWLSFGLKWMLDRWQDLVGSAWLAILLLSLSVKLLMAPLIAVAERWQADVNRTRSLLEPELAAIRREFRGEEAHNRILAVYRRHGVSHFYTFKSLAGFLIQVPVFIAAFDMLGENFRLSGEGFLWIADLALPDRAAALPFAVPFFGAHLNLLPFVMTAFTVLAARLQEDESLAAELRRGQRLRLYAMAGVFLVLLYTFPAGMVLYWTANNLWHLLRVSRQRLLPRPVPT